MAIYQMVMRTGWIFKTESIIMPAVLDSLGGAAWLRSCLPLLNRFGQSVPPLMMARRLKVMRFKKRALASCSLLMGFCFLALAGIWAWHSAPPAWWMPWSFLAVYCVFFMGTGVNQLAFHTLQGKLIAPTLRGRLMLASNVLGATTAIVCAALLLSLWLRQEGGDFAKIFGFAGACFALAGVLGLSLREKPDSFQQPATSIRRVFGSAVEIIRRDSNFRRAAVVASLFGASMMLFPHYQALGLTKLHLQLDSLIGWVILQNAGTALFSFIVGPLADKRGNRLVLQGIILGICLAPLAALGLAYLGGPLAARLYSGVFLLVGLTPVAIRTFQNYTLEIAQPADHPKYLSTMSLCLAVPIIFSPLVGALIDVVGFLPIFLAVTGLLGAGWLLSFRMVEPRHGASLWTSELET